MTKSQARETRELRIRHGVIERLQFLFESACSNVQVVNDVVWQKWNAVSPGVYATASNSSTSWTYGPDTSADNSLESENCAVNRPQCNDRRSFGMLAF